MGRIINLLAWLQNALGRLLWLGRASRLCPIRGRCSVTALICPCASNAWKSSRASVSWLFFQGLQGNTLSLHREASSTALKLTDFRRSYFRLLSLLSQLNFKLFNFCIKFLDLSFIPSPLDPSRLNLRLICFLKYFFILFGGKQLL